MSGARGSAAMIDDEDDIPLTPAPARESARDQSDDTSPGSFEIIDVDDNFQPSELLGQDTQPAQGDDQGDGTEDRLGETQTARREREDKSTRRARQREARDRTIVENRRLTAEIAELRELVQDRIEPRLNAFDESRTRQNAAELDRALADANTRATRSKRALTEAMIAQDGEAMNAALDERDQAFIEVQQLTARKQVIERTGRDPMAERQDGQRQQQTRETTEQPQRAAPLPRAAKELMTDFQAKHDWINPQRDRQGGFTDDDTAVLMRLDNGVFRDGFNPSDPDYWEELEDRARKYLPHRFSNGAIARTATRPTNGQLAQRPAQEQRRGPMVAAGNNGTTRPGANKVYLTAGRKDALIRAGVLESDGKTVSDAPKFQKMMKSFQAYDAANGVARQ